ncbi:fibrinogen-like YCDxxxxGGGW domain-containing protein [Nannocystis radixulma]|uniref:Fibrinogen-like YCDxxxxGGGW domain-containing protein n=1 Tax=Nannocystis radixulma TaxID=2995305 RepID=A0ABT5BJ57_9BACT|nr:fibrinogen-like YCDxxxxGGGW domain-containing protein [Nannocystis radixulma]MDC0674191.1 fibrinogen-like YCDxxxxGGGW domain-containing protein [Nannocystis radixulma]
MRTGGSVAGAVAMAWMAGCLETNPWFAEPTESGSATTTGTPGGPTSDVTTGGPTSETTTTPTSTGMETDTPVVTESSTVTTAPLTTTMTTGVQPICGDGIVEAPEECDEGPANDDEGACTTFCLHAACGDGFVQSGEGCDDKNPDSNDGCVACVVPHACREIREIDPLAETGLYKIVPDAPGLMPLIPVFCDMDLDGGGWTLVERSPRGNPIGVALYKDFAQNQGNPMAPSYRMPRGAMSTVVAFSDQMRLDCGGPDHLLAAAPVLFAGELGPQDCSNAGPVFYAEAELMGHVLMNVSLCTQFPGFNDGQCPGAWSIDEENQSPCQLDNHPWTGGETVVLPMTDAFAVDPQHADPAHDCHKPNATRQILLR